MFFITSLLIHIFTFLGHCPEMEQEAQSAGSVLVERTIICPLPIFWGGYSPYGESF